jgi:hypothetical protein
MLTFDLMAATEQQSILVTGELEKHWRIQTTREGLIKIHIPYYEIKLSDNMVGAFMAKEISSCSTVPIAINILCEKHVREERLGKIYDAPVQGCFVLSMSQRRYDELRDKKMLNLAKSSFAFFISGRYGENIDFEMIKSELGFIPFLL